MKKIIVLLLAFAMINGMLFASGADDDSDDYEEGADFSIGLVTDTGGIDDKSFNQGTWEGILAFKEDYGLSDDQVQYLQSENDADYIPNLSTFADEGFDLIVAPGFLFEESITEVANNYPDQKFLLIDMVVEPTNIVDAVFAEEQGSFLVGVAAALKAQEAGKNTVGFIGGIDFALIQKFEAGFEEGVAAVDPNIKVLVEYAGSFSDTQKGQIVAAKLYDQGAYVIYHAAGATGNGAIKEAKDRVQNNQDVWIIGVDKDQYEEGVYAGNKSVVLTSMVKRVDVAAYSVAEMTYEDNFPEGEILVFTLENDGVGIPVINPNLSSDILQQVNTYKEQVISGAITVGTTPSRLK